MASTISAPFFGPRAISERVHIRRPLRPCIFHPKGHMGIDKPILEYRYIKLWRACQSSCPRSRTGGLRSRRDAPEQLNPDSIGIADEREGVSRFPERFDLCAGPLRGEFAERTVHVGDAKGEVVEFFSPPIGRV